MARGASSWRRRSAALRAREGAPLPGEASEGPGSWGGEGVLGLARQAAAAVDRDDAEEDEEEQVEAGKAGRPPTSCSRRYTYERTYTYFNVHARVGSHELAHGAAQRLRVRRE
mmetsp:Transcript_4581/g.11747  ORF Transcript_4581/g.11747 Transcript_4581/m.11747 type:complete len:113 (-) Transcript_4581:16-354(-)